MAIDQAIWIKYKQPIEAIKLFTRVVLTGFEPAIDNYRGDSRSCEKIN
jgi:hypothetical protein